MSATSADTMEDVNEDSLRDLLCCAYRHHYHVLDNKHDEKVVAVQRRVLRLLAADYAVQRLDNDDGELGVNYPAQMALLGERGARVPDVARLRQLAVVARMGRCRGRFPVGVILYNGRHVCRSATLSVGAEMYPRHYYFSMFGASNVQHAVSSGPSSALSSEQQQQQHQHHQLADRMPAGADFAAPSGNSTNEAPESQASAANDSASNSHRLAATDDVTSDAPDSDDVITQSDNCAAAAAAAAQSTLNDSQQLFDRIRNQDVCLLKLFGVGTIADLMVETKKVKFGIYVASSEKVDKLERYAQFQLLNMPYPGCEFFRHYPSSGYRTAGLVFDWTQKYINAELSLPAALTRQVGVDFSQYRRWHTAELTGNYLKLLLAHLHSPQLNGAASAAAGGGGGLLIHCISGWDRTPLFISLLRLSLWADGLIHRSLDAAQILYLTLAYDWFLFGHNLPGRVALDQEIMHFTFNFLKDIEADEFSAFNFRSNVSDGGCHDNDINHAQPSASSHCQPSVNDDETSSPTACRSPSRKLAEANNCANDIGDRAVPITTSTNINADALSIDSSASALSALSGVAGGVSSDSVDYTDNDDDNDDDAAGCWPFVTESGCDRHVLNDHDDDMFLDDVSVTASRNNEDDAEDQDDDEDDEGSIRVLSAGASYSPPSYFSPATSPDALSSVALPPPPPSSLSSSLNGGGCRRAEVGSPSATGRRTSSLPTTTAGLDESFCQLDLTVHAAGKCCTSTAPAVPAAAAAAASSSLGLTNGAHQTVAACCHQKQRCCGRWRHQHCCSAAQSSGGGEMSRSGESPEQCDGVPAAAAGPMSSPLMVPKRNRHESCGSVGSWQIISETGSTRSSISNSSYDVSQQFFRNDSCLAPVFIESTGTLIGDAHDDVTHAPLDCSSRAGRLRCVRHLFLLCYSSVVGLKTPPDWQRVVAPPHATTGRVVNEGAAAAMVAPSCGESSVGRRFRLLPTVMSSLAGRVGIM